MVRHVAAVAGGKSGIDVRSREGGDAHLPSSGPKPHAKATSDGALCQRVIGVESVLDCQIAAAHRPVFGGQVNLSHRFPRRCVPKWSGRGRGPSAGRVVRARPRLGERIRGAMVRSFVGGRAAKASAYRFTRIAARSFSMRSNTPCQSPGRLWRNSRIVGYQGVSVRSSIQRQSGE